MKAFTFFLVLVVGLSACGSNRKLASTEPPARSLPSLPASEINLPIKVNLRPLLQIMDSVTATQFTNDHWPEYTQTSCDFRYKYRFIRSPFTFSCVNNKVTLAFNGLYQIAGSKRICAFEKQVTPWVGGSCGFGTEPLRRVELKIGSVLELLPNHALRTSTRLESTKAPDKCVVTLLNTDITKMVMDSIRASVDSYCVAFDSLVQAINQAPFLVNWRNSQSRVMPLSQYGFLNLNPTQLRVGRFNTYRDTLLLSVGFSGTPLFASDSNRLVTGKNLPPITLNASNTGINAYLHAVYDYAFFNKLLNDSLHNKPFELEGKTFVIKSVAVSGTNEGNLTVDLAFTGYKSGVLHLSGTPTLDTALQVLSMPDIRFSIDTRDMIVKMGQNLFRKKILRKLRDESVLDIAELVLRNKAAIEARMNQPITDWLQSSGQLHEIRILGLLPQKNHIEVQAFIRADLSLTGTPTASMLSGFQ